MGESQGGEKAAVDTTARLLMAAWEKAEGKPVSASYVATFADMARAVLEAFGGRAAEEWALATRYDTAGETRYQPHVGLASGGRWNETITAAEAIERWYPGTVVVRRSLIHFDHPHRHEGEWVEQSTSPGLPPAAEPGQGDGRAEG